MEIREGDRVRSAFAESIEPDGSLLVKEEDGTEKRLFSGEVSLRIIPQDQE